MKAHAAFGKTGYNWTATDTWDHSLVTDDCILLCFLECDQVSQLQKAKVKLSFRYLILEHLNDGQECDVSELTDNTHF
jgi:hypothetical protein